MAPRKHDIVQATVWLVNSIFGRVNGVTRVWVPFERLRVNNLIGKLAADNKGIANDVPLTPENRPFIRYITYDERDMYILRAKEIEQFTEVVNQASHLHPFRLIIAADSLSRLKQVLNLRHAGLL